MDEVDISELLEFFSNIKKTKLIGDKQVINGKIASFLDSNLSAIIEGRTNPPYDGAKLVHQLINISIQELDFNIAKGYKKDGSFKRDAFNNAAKFVPTLILADSIEAEDSIVITWYHRICNSELAENFVFSVLPCVIAFFSTVTPVDIPGNDVVEVWSDLWKRVYGLHSMDYPCNPRYGGSNYFGSILECIGAILRISKQTPLADHPWNTVRTVIDGLALNKDDAKIWQRLRLSAFSPLLRLLRIVLHEWGFSYRVQLTTAMESMMKNISMSIEYDKNMAEWSMPWSEIRKESPPAEHAWLLLEEYASLVTPKGCPIHIPSGTIHSESALFEFAELLVVKYAKSVTSVCVYPSPSACRLVARSLVAQHRLQRASGSCDEEDAAGDCSSQLGSQLASFTKMRVASQFSSQFGGIFSTQMASQRSQMGSTQMILKRRKRKREAKLLQSMAALDFEVLLHDCTSIRVNSTDEIAVEWMKYVIECMNQVYGEHMQDLGQDAADLVQLTIAKTKTVTREDLIPAVASLLCTIMQKLQGEEVEESCPDANIPSTSRRSSRGGSDGAAISELWSRALSWTHMPTCFESATRLLIECDRWLLAHEHSSTLQSELRWARMIEVLKPSPLSSSAAVDLLLHLIASYEFDEKERLTKYEGKHMGKEWPFRRELIDWLLSRDANLDISSAIVAVCSYYPKREIGRPVDRRSSPWVNQECRVRALVRTQLDSSRQRADSLDTRPNTLIKEMVDAVVEGVGNDPSDHLIELRRLCVLQRLTTRVKRTKREGSENQASSDILPESFLSVKQEKEMEGMEVLAERRWESCVWFDSYGVNLIDTEILVRLLQHEEIIDGLPDMIFTSLVARRDELKSNGDRQKMTALVAIMRQFMNDLPETTDLVGAIQSIAACPSLLLMPHVMKRMGEIAEKLVEAVESIMDVQRMIYLYGHMIPPESRARLIDKMSILVDDEKEAGEEHCFAHHMEEIVIAHYAMEIRVEYAMIDMDRPDVVERVLTPESLISRLQLESDRGEMTGECEELVKASLSPGRWEDHADTVRTVARWPELMRRCLSSQPLLCSIMDEMAAAIDIDTVIKREIKEEEMDTDDDHEEEHKNYIDLENLWSPIQRDISRSCSGLRARKGEEEQFSCSMADSSLPTALLLPRVDWSILQREWRVTMPAHALKILTDYGKRCKEIGLELRFIQIVEYLIGQSGMESSSYRFMLEALAEEAVWSIHSRCSSRSTDFIRASAQWSRIRSRMRPTVSPSHFRLMSILMDRSPRAFEEGDADTENLTSLISIPEWWKHATKSWDEEEKEDNDSPSSQSTLSTLRSQLINAYRIVHEARCVPETAATVLPKIVARGGLGGMVRSSFDADYFVSWLRLHMELWIYGRRFTESSPEEIQMVMDAFEEKPLGVRRTGNEKMPEERKRETDIVTRLLRLAHSTTKSEEWKCLLARLTTVLPALGLHCECLPFLVALCPQEKSTNSHQSPREGAIETILMSTPDLLQERDEEKEGGGERRGRRREEREGSRRRRRVGDVAILLEECITVVGISSFSRACAENGRDAEEPLADMAKLAIDSGVMSLARICIDLVTESCLPNRPLFIFESAFTLPDCLEETRKAAVIATRDAVTARSLNSATQAQEQIRRILAESRFDWHLSSSDEARAILDEEEENYLLRFTQWTSFSKLHSSSSEDFLNGALVLMQKNERASQRIVERLRCSISSRLCSSLDILSNQVRKDVRCAQLLNIFKEENEESSLPPSLVPLAASTFPSSSNTHLDDECLLRVGVELARRCRRREEENIERGESMNESFSISSVQEKTDARVNAAVKHLEAIKAYKPSLRLLSQWSSLCESKTIRARVALDEARIRVEMGEEYVGLHMIEKIKKEHEMDGRILAHALFLEADIALEQSKNREKSREIVRTASSLLSSLSESSWNGDDAAMMHKAQAKIFNQTAKILEETQTIMESRGFIMKREAIETWSKQLDELNKRSLDTEKKTKVRLEREVACETEEITRMESRMATLAIECIVAGLDALKSTPNTEPDTSAEILFPLLDVLFKYGQTERVGAIIREHLIQSSCVHFVQGVGHIVGHVFKETPITKPLRLVLVKLVMLYPYHVLPRLLFYYDAGGCEEKNIREIINKAIKSRENIEEDVKKIVKAHFMFRDFTQADVRNRTLFIRGQSEGKEVYRMTERVSLLRDQEALSLVPMPTVHLEPNQSIDTVPHITHVKDVFSQADGLSVPKVLTVRTSEGIERRIICKKEDVRQDAMVEHLFEAINTILQQANGGPKYQELRTYKVVPLDINNGLIEFCGGTISLKELLCGMDRVSGLHKEIHPEDMTAKDALYEMSQAHYTEKVEKFKYVCERLRPVFRHYFYKEYGSPSEWSRKLDAYRRSLAQWSIVCYIVGLGDRHSSNVLFEPATAKFVHIDLGMILEYSKRSLPVPERVPFRLTRDLVDPLIGDALDGHFTTICVDTIVALRKKSSVLLGIASALLRETMSNFEEATPSKESSLISKTAIGRLRDKLVGTDAGFAPQTPEEQVRRLIGEATDMQNLATIFHGWMPFL